MPEPLLEISGLTKVYPITTGLFKETVGHLRAVDSVSFMIPRGQTLGLVGESGCGKTTTGRMILRLIERTAGDMFFHQNGNTVNIGTLQGEQLRRFRRHMQLVFQDPYSSLNPRMTVFDIIAEPLRSLGSGSSDDIEARVRELTASVGLKVEFLRRYPHAFSGGQRQRIGIARALAVRPELVVCDEPVSALDVSVQAQIVNLLKDLQTELGLTYLFIAHDLSVVENISHRVAVMYAGRIVEMADTDTIFHHPRHPYTHALLAAVPNPTPAQPGQRPLLSGEVADPSNLPSGCSFHPRCPLARDVCRSDVPMLRPINDEHMAACHRTDQTARTIPLYPGGSS